MRDHLLTDPDHCGGCGNVCNPLHAEPECISGACTVGSCEEPFDDCDNYATNGCEINLSSDAENCGACGMACLAINGEPRCEGGECRIDCQTGFGDCNGDAQDGCEKAVTSDVNNCNGCGMVCPEQDGYTAYCVGGACGEDDVPGRVRQLQRRAGRRVRAEPARLGRKLRLLRQSVRGRERHGGVRRR